MSSSGRGDVQTDLIGEIDDITESDREIDVQEARNYDTEYDYIYCSDLNRVKETCSAALHAGQCESKFASKIIYSSLLREKNAGEFESRSKALMIAARKRYGNERTFRPKSGESWDDVQKRIQNFIHEVKETVRRRPATDGYPRVLIFTSGGVIKEFINFYVYGPTDRENVARNQLWNCSRRFYPNSAANGSIFVFRAIAADEFEMVVENYIPRPITITGKLKSPSDASEHSKFSPSAFPDRKPANKVSSRK